MFIVYLGLVRAVLAFMLYFYITIPLITRHSLFTRKCKGYTNQYPMCSATAKQHGRYR